MKMISLNPSRACIYHAPDRSSFHFPDGFPRMQVARNSRPKAEISKKAQQRLRNAVNWLTFLSRKRKVNPKHGRSITNFQVSFITLTLPAKQMHSHAEIKSRCLHYFFTQIGRQFSIKNYVWKAELQKNGNIHFHLTTDVYIHHMAIRRIWNKSIEILGYVSEYQRIYQGMAFHDYHEWRCQAGYTDIVSNQKAYTFGIKSNWNSPNSTDVHSVNDVTNLAAYMAKYLTKAPVDLEKTGPIADSAKELSGRLWFLSTSLSKLGNAKLPFTMDNARWISMLRACRSIFKFESDWVELLFFQLGKIPAKMAAFLTEHLVTHAVQLYYPFPAHLPVHGNQIFKNYVD